MLRNNYIVVLICILTIKGNIFSQNKLTDFQLQQKFSNYIPQRNDLKAENFFQEMSQAMQLSKDSEFNFISVYEANNNSKHLRFQQFHKSLPVIGNSYILHEKDGRVTKATGLFTPDISLNTIPATSARQAISAAEKLLRNLIVKNNPLEYEFEISSMDNPMLCIIDAAFPGNSDHNKLAYQVDLECPHPLKKMRYYIDAQHNSLIYSYPLLQEHSVPSTGVTKYYGLQTIVTDSIAPDDFVLKDLTRGRGISVKNNSGDIYHHTSSHWDLTNIKKDEVAIDAMYCTEKYFDLLLNRFDWESIDGEGVPLNIKVHNNALGVTNAYWDGNTANFGDGTCSRGPLTTLEIVGHELTHGLIQYTSQMIYDSESGALNESIADMFGKSLEYEADPAGFSWGLGHSIHLKDGLLPFRRMDDPKSMGMPAFYKGQNWVDDNEVHFNSSIGNLWFVILSDGRAGINEAGEQFAVQGLGIENAHRIVFLANNAYNISNTNYNQFAKNTLYAAEELYGINSGEYSSVKEAWKAVGLPSAAGTLKKDLAITSPSEQRITCELGEYLPLTIQLTNSGTESYDPASAAYIWLYSLTNGIVTLPLNEEILPGEVKIFEVNNWMKYTGQNYESYNIQIMYDDDYPDNDGSLIFVEYRASPANDLAVNIYTSGTNACKGNRQKFNAGILNNSCAAIPAGEKFELSFKDESGIPVWNSEIILEEDLESGLYYYEEFYADLDFTGSRNYSMELKYEPDPDINNNYFNIELSPTSSLETDYLQEFDDLPGGLEPLSIYSLYPFPTIYYQNESYLGFTGYYPDTTIRERCGYAEEIFLNTGKILASASVCVNYPEAENVTVEFDAVLFKNRFNEISYYPYSSMMQVSWEGNESGSELIYDQEDGLKVHHTIPLPPKFSGTIFFKFFTEIGKQSVDQLSYQSDDVVLMDNLRIHTDEVSKIRSLNESGFYLYPNPCTDHLNLENVDKSDIVKMEVIDLIGRRQIDLNINDEQFYVGCLTPGVYFLKMTGLNQQTQVLKFVKI